MKIFSHLYYKLFCQPLMLLEGVRFGLESALLERMDLRHGGSAGGLSYEASMRPSPERGPRAAIGEPGRVDEEWLAMMKMAAATKQSWRVEKVYQSVGPVGVVSIGGVIDKHLSDMDLDCYGGCDLADVDKALSIAEDDDDIEKVALAINSPGGSVVGVPETAARVARLAQKKQVEAFVDGMACSAAFYIASQADAIKCAPSAQLGSVGVYCTMVDATRAAEMAGYKVELIKAGKYKAMGNAFNPLSDEERSMIQERVTRMHQQFRAAVNSRRPQCTLDDMEGQSFDGVESVAKGLADDLTYDNLDEFVADYINR